MDLVNEIREYFASIPCSGAMEIKSLPSEYSAYVIRIPNGYGVAVEVDTNLEAAEKFNSIKMHTLEMTLDGSTKNYLILRSAVEEYRYEFASVCAEFVDPGPNGSNRAKLLADPYTWWMKWKELVGNTNSDQSVYSVIAEMMVLYDKFKTDKTAEWASTRMGSHDIECAEESCEVKSSIKRYGVEITISGQHQLDHVKPLYLYFCKLEESLEGESINDLKARLVSAGYDEARIETELEKQGYERGSNIRNKRYKKLEGRIYTVDDSFPRIVPTSFKNNKLPDAVIRVQYTIDLNAISYSIW